MSGARAAAEHLLGLGHERLGVVSFELGRDASGGLAGLERRRRATYRPSRLRLEGYAAAVEDAGLCLGRRARLRGRGEHAGAG